MKPPSLFRSLVFWSGLLVMGFIGWMWVDSTMRMSYVRGPNWELASWASGVSVMNGSRLAYKWEAGQAPPPTMRVNYTSRGTRAFSIESGHLDPELRRVRLARAGFLAGAKPGEEFVEFLPRLNAPELDAALRENGRRNLLASGSAYVFSVLPGGWVLFIPHWLLLLAVVLGWVGSLAWRARRIRRHEKSLTTIDAVA
ncbi:hypothetical protein [Haloferula sp. BvORR071]|uniref:hypothetical protein n=1 Tax=Haloferula sp. BvORR071 TaxID=1396141 RepID=UPI0005524413|nr:hypothetical protein [Haloferula sp. BvORR071]